MQSAGLAWKASQKDGASGESEHARAQRWVHNDLKREFFKVENNSLELTHIFKESFKDQRWAWEESARAEKRDRDAERERERDVSASTPSLVREWLCESGCASSMQSESGCASSMTNFEFCRDGPHSMELPTLVLMYSWSKIESTLSNRNQRQLFWIDLA